jgi:8-oxo-dGTP diphosphatase
VPESYRHSVSVAGVVVREDGRILVIRRRDNGHYQAPGGVLELAERIEDGLVREVREETGLLVEPERLTGIYKHMSFGVVALVFRCRPVGGEPTVNEEASEVLWLERDEIVAAMTEAFAVRVTDALEDDPGPHIRHHDGTHLCADPE